MKLILHIGQPKTGTTSIQNLLQINKDLLRKNGYIYETNAFNHQPILQNINSKENVFNELIKFADKQKAIATQYNAKAIILSSEALFNYDMNFLKQMIEAFNLETKAIVYLKRQDLFLESSWKQWHFKNKHYVDFEDYSQRANIEDYSKTLDKWSDLIGEKNIIISPFEKRNFPQGLLKHFLSLINVSNDIVEKLNYDIPKTMFGTNQGLSPKGLKFATLSKELADGPLDYTIEVFIHKYLDEVFHKEYFDDYGLFTYEKRKEYMSKWKEINIKIARSFLNKEILFEDEIKEDKKNVDVNMDDIAKVVMNIGIQMDKKLTYIEEKLKKIEK